MINLDAAQIGRNIARHREQLNISAEELAQQARLPARSIVRIEAGERRIDIAALARIAFALGVTVEEIMLGK